MPDVLEDRRIAVDHENESVRSHAMGEERRERHRRGARHRDGLSWLDRQQLDDLLSLAGLGLLRAEARGGNERNEKQQRERGPAGHGGRLYVMRAAEQQKFRRAS